MAEKRTTGSPDETAAAVPRARAADPEPTPSETAAKATPRKPAAKKAAKKATPPEAPGTKAAARKSAKKAAKKAAKKTAKQTAKQTATKIESAEAAPAPAPAPVPEPARELVPAEPAREPVPAEPPPPTEEWAAAAWEAVRRPERPPRRLAELAVAEVGPRAAAWAQWLRATYPGVPPDGMVRLATRQAVRLGRMLSFAGSAGPFVAPVSVPAAGWVRATVVLRVAAAYGLDPTAAERAGELLELLGATTEADDDLPAEPLDLALRFARRLQFIRFVPSRLRWRRSPLASLPRLLLRAGQEAEDLERLAHRAARFYRSYPGSASKVHSSAESSSSRNRP